MPRRPVAAVVVAGACLLDTACTTVNIFRARAFVLRRIPVSRKEVWCDARPTKTRKKAHRDIEEEFARILDYQAPDTAVDHAMSDLMEASAFQKGYSLDDVTLAVRRKIIAALDCLQTVLRAAKSF